MGLLSDIGHMVMSIRAPDLMYKVLSKYQKTGYPLYQLERAIFGFDYGELGADILEGWSIPNPIISGVRYQNCPEIAPEYQQEAAIVYCAGRLQTDEQTFPDMVDVEALRLSNIGYMDYDRIRSRIKSLYNETLAVFPISSLKQTH